MPTVDGGETPLEEQSYDQVNYAETGVPSPEHDVFEVISTEGENGRRYGIRLQSINKGRSSYFYNRLPEKRFEGFGFGSHLAQISIEADEDDEKKIDVLLHLDVNEVEFKSLKRRLSTDFRLSNDQRRSVEYYYSTTHVIPTGGRIYFDEMTYIQNTMAEILSIWIPFDHKDKSSNFKESLDKRNHVRLLENDNPGLDYRKLFSFKQFYQWFKR